MRKSRILTTILGTLLLALVVLPAAAQSPTDLNVLAQYFPADTPIFISVRTDDAFIETLDALVERVRAALPEAAGSGETLADALDNLADEIFPGGTFEEDLRPLLGDTASIGLTSAARLADDDRSNDENPPAIIALSIKDRTAVIDLIANANMRAEQTTEKGYTLFTPDASVTGERADDAVIVRDDVLLYYTVNESIPVGGVPDGSLNTNEGFTSTLALLPEPSYNMTLFLNTRQFIEAAGETDPDAAEALEAFGPMFNAVGSQVWGFTILGGDSLTIDIAQQMGDMSAITDLGFQLGSMTPIDPAFAAHIPADVPLAILGTDIKTALSSAANNFQLMAQTAAMQDGDFDPEELAEGVEQFNQAFTQMTGLNFEQDVLSWMTGDYALFLSLNPDLNLRSQFGIFQAFPVDFGFAIEATDAAAAQKTVDGLTQAIQAAAVQVRAQSENAEVETEIEVTDEEIGDADVTVVTITASNAPWPVEILMGANDDVFALGTRSAVRAILAPDGGLPSNAEFQRASAYILPKSVSLGWLNTEGLLPLADLAAAFDRSNDAEANAGQARRALGLFSSGTMSSAYNEDGSALIRMVLTFAE